MRPLIYSPLHLFFTLSLYITNSYTSTTCNMAVMPLNWPSSTTSTTQSQPGSLQFQILNPTGRILSDLQSCTGKGKKCSAPLKSQLPLTYDISYTGSVGQGSAKRTMMTWAYGKLKGTWSYPSDTNWKDKALQPFDCCYPRVTKMCILHTSQAGGLTLDTKPLTVTVSILSSFNQAVLGGPQDMTLTYGDKNPQWLHSKLKDSMGVQVDSNQNLHGLYAGRKISPVLSTGNGPAISDTEFECDYTEPNSWLDP